MSWTRSRETNLSRLCRRREREKLRNLKDTLDEDERAIYEWKGCGAVKYQPFPVGAFDRLSSNNIWEMVSEYLTHPTDIINAGLACPEVFTERRMLASLQETLGILRQRKQLYSQTQSEYKENLKINCLSVRGVSKAWKQIFDAEVFESNFGLTSWYMLHMDTKDICQFVNEEAIKMALASFPFPMYRPKQSNVSMLRELLVDTTQITEGEDRNVFHAKLIYFLELFGRSVWLLEYKTRWSHGPDSFVGAYKKICEIVRLTPNLRALILKEFEEDLNEEISDFLENVRLKEGIIQSPFPSLISMESFHFEGMDNALILEEILRKSGNLKSVSSRFPHRISKGMAKALWNLELESYSKVNEELITYISGKYLNWPLAKISILINDLEYAKTSFLWPFLNQFGLTLKFLEIHVPVARDDVNIQLDLPHLKYLILCTITPPNTIGFDDLLQLKSLERMLLAYFEDDFKLFRKNAKSHGQINLCINKKKLQTNLWNCFPELKQLCIDVRGEDMATYYRPSNLRPQHQVPLRFTRISRWKAFTKWFWASIYFH